MYIRPGDVPNLDAGFVECMAEAIHDEVCDWHHSWSDCSARGRQRAAARAALAALRKEER